MIHRLAIISLSAFMTVPCWSAAGNRNGCEDIFNDRVSQGYSLKEVEGMKSKVVKDMTVAQADTDPVKRKRALLRRAVSNCDHAVQKFGSASHEAEVAISKVEDAQDAVLQARVDKE